jgi:ribosomal protein L40E
MAAKFTVSELAVLRVVADEVAEKGVCSRTLAELSARAGCCRSTAQNALRAAAKAGLITIEERRRRGQKNLPNLVRITSAEWSAWLARGGQRTGFKKNAPTDNSSRNKGRVEAWSPTTAMQPLHRTGPIRSKSLIGERGVKRCWA